jgi:serine/threonine-protein kinase
MKSFKLDIKIGKQIGAGHFGVVCLAEDPVHGTVAVKRLTRALSESEASWRGRKADLLKEAQNLKAATHRNVVAVHHLLEEEGGDEIIFAMDFCSGGSLQNAYETGPLPLRSVRKIATEITQGLQALHARGMIHRDIKPGNVLIDENGTAKLGDFGLVTDDIILGYAAAIGYKDHLAPEVWSGQGTSVKTDIWALGMTLYRLMHGSAWYSNAVAPQDIVPDGGYSKTLKWLPHIPDSWRRLVRRTLHDDTATRFQTATELFGALGALPACEWHCEVGQREIKWQRDKGARKIIVTWTMHSKKHNEWHAWSEPKGIGKVHTLGGSDEILSSREVERDLLQFFKNNS